MTNESEQTNSRWRTAIVAILSAFAGGASTAAATYFTTMEQIASSAAESRTEFYRQQKQTLYTQLIQDSADADHPLSNYAHEFAVSDDPKSDDFSRLRDDLSPVLGKIRNDYYAIRVIGGTAVDAARKVMDARAAQFAAVDDLYKKWMQHDLSAADRRASYVPYPPAQRAAVAAESAFADAAYKDLEST